MALKDKIGREEVVNKICYLVDNLQKEHHFCLALNGEWGSGKSFVLDLIEEKIQNSDHKEYLIMKYDAWKNNFYPDPLIAILYCILDSLQSKMNLVEDNKKSIINAVKQTIKKKASEKFDEIINSLYKVGKWAAVCAFAIETIKSVIVQAKSSILDNKLFDDYKSYQTLLCDSINVLNALTEYEYYVGKQTKLIILVDEIDRCLPNEQLIVLERLHHIFAVKNCAVIVALNKDSITTAFEHSYGGEGEKYLKKFFDYNFKIETNYSLLLRNSLNDLLDEINVKQSSDNLILKEDTDYIGRYLSKLCSTEIKSFNNRECFRLINAAKSICRLVPANGMNYCYLWFIFVMTFEKLYGRDFITYKNGTASSMGDIKDVGYSKQTLTEKVELPYGCHTVCLYTDDKVNHLCYMINQFIVRNNNQLNGQFYSIKQSWLLHANIKAIWGIKDLEQIMAWIDNYS